MNTSKSLKIFHLVTRSDIGGAQEHIDLLINELDVKYRFSLCFGSSKSDDEKRFNGNVKIFVIPEIKTKYCFSSLIRVHRIIKSEKPDLIHTHSAIASFIGRIAGRFAGVKTLYTIHGWHFVQNSVWKRRVFGWVLELFARPFTTAWIAVSDYDLKLGVKKGVVDSKRAWVVPNGVANIQYNRTKPLNSDGLNLVFVGRASFQKNCLEAIEVLKLCSDTVTLTMYVTRGDHLSAIENSISDNNLTPRIELIADNPDASNQLQNYDALLLTSRYEGMPLCVLEAMRVGLPVISSDVCGMSELVDNDVTGFLYPLSDVNEAANCISKLNDFQVRQRLGKEAQKRFLNNHTAELMAARTAEIYEKLLAI